MLKIVSVMMTSFFQNRRSFLKTGTTLVGGVLLTKYIEPIVPIAELNKHEWIEDKGDFYIVRVPDSKTFAKEILDKPTIFLLGHYSVVKDIVVNGYINVAIKGESLIHDCIIDASKIMLPSHRPMAVVDHGYLEANKLRLERCHFKSNPVQPPTSGFMINANPGSLTLIA